MTPRDRDRASFLGSPLDPLTMEETVAHCCRVMRERRSAQHVVLNAGKCVLIEDEPDLREIIARCELVNADGQSVVWAARLLGIRIPERVAGIDLMARLLAEAEKERWPVYFLGGRREVLTVFEAEVMRRHPRLVVAGRRDGYFRLEDEAGIAESIRASGARLLLVGISSPAKERFLSRNLDHMGALLATGVGGSFDVWAGKTTRAPEWMQRAGLEWLHRFAQEPRRMWRRYLIGNVRFAVLVLRARFAVHGPGREQQ